MTPPQLKLVKPDPLVTSIDISDLVKLYAEFHTAYGLAMTRETQELYAKLIEEEHEEWLEEYFSLTSKEANELKELTDLLYVTIGLSHTLKYKLEKTDSYQVPEYYDSAITEMVSEIATGNFKKATLSNLICCIYGYAQAMGWNLTEAFKRVHASNMSKLGPDGKPIRREDGKVLKGPQYTLPNLEDLTNG